MKTRTEWVWLLLSALVAGCASAAPTYTADGQKGHIISCSGGGLYGTYVASWGQCYQKAGEACGEQGFNILERVGEDGFSATVGQYGGAAGTTKNRVMVIQCKGEAAKLTNPPA